MAQRAASYGEAVLHKSAFLDETATFHSAMKHSLRSYDEKMKNESLSVCKTIRFALYYHRKRKLIMEKSSNKLVDLSVTICGEIKEENAYSLKNALRELTCVGCRFF